MRVGEIHKVFSAHKFPHLLDCQLEVMAIPLQTIESTMVSAIYGSQRWTPNSAL